MPADDFLVRARDYFGGVSPHRIPTLLWLGAGTGALRLVCGTGLLFSKIRESLLGRPSSRWD